MYENKKQKLDILIDNLNKTLLKKYDNAKHKFEILKNNYLLNNPNLIYKDKRNNLNNLIDKLELVNPLGVLKRGYSLTYKEGKVINNVNNLNKNDNILIKFYDGEISANVINIKEIKND